MSEKPSRPADRVRVTGQIRPRVLDPGQPIVIQRSLWNLTISGGTFTATHAGELEEDHARAEVSRLMDVIINQLSFARDIPIDVAIDSFSAEWTEGERRMISVGEAAGQVEHVGVVFRRTSLSLASSAYVALGPDGIGVRDHDGAVESVVQHLESLYSSMLRSVERLVVDAAGIADIVEAEFKTGVLSRALLEDVGFLANKADIGCFSRHPESHKTNDLPPDAALWIRSVARKAVEGARCLNEGLAWSASGRGDCPTPSWIALRAPRPSA